jgi:hypothetical protein
MKKTLAAVFILLDAALRSSSTLGADGAAEEIKLQALIFLIIARNGFDEEVANDDGSGGQPTCNGNTIICTADIGSITETVAAETITFLRDSVTSSSFSVGVSTSAPAVFFDFAPQGSVVGEQRVWLSREPAGEVLNGETSDRCDVRDISRAYTLAAYISGRSTRDDPTRFCVINPGETYYLNQQLLGTMSSQTVVRSIGGAF